MTFRLGLAQCAHPQHESVEDLVRRFARDAASQGVDLLVFPECLMTPFEKTREDFIRTSEPLGGPFSQAMARIAREYGLWMVYTMNERGQACPPDTQDAPNAPRTQSFPDAPALNPPELPSSPKAQGTPGNQSLPNTQGLPDTQSAPNAPLPFNTAVVVDSAGETRGFYRKTHLYDALSVQESERMAPGDRLFEPVDTPFCRLGIGICYDLRFPEVARASALAGCEVFVLPAAWVDGPHKASQWRTLLSARAIENEMFIAGLSRADARYVGESCIVNPLGEVVACAAGKEETLVIHDIDLNLIRTTRSNMPLFEHRRPRLYKSLAESPFSA